MPLVLFLTQAYTKSAEYGFYVGGVKHVKEEHVYVGRNKVYTINQIDWWLLKYEEHYVFCKTNWNNNSCFGDLPCEHTMDSDMSKFYRLYEDLVEISDIHN